MKTNEKEFDFSVVRNLRRKHGMTTEELAQEANLTRMSISKIELGNSNPTMRTVKALAEVFQLFPSELVRLAEKTRCEMPKIRDFKIGDMRGLHLVFPGFQIYRAYGNAGDESEFDPSIHENTAELAFVLSGKIRVTFSEESYDLGPNMALRFKAMHEHKVQAIEDSEFLMIMLGLA